MIRSGLRPGVRLAIDRSAANVTWRRVFPVQKNWVVIGIVAAIDAAFLAPAVMTFGQAAAAWMNFDSLFDLVIAIFLSAWLLGWGIAPLILTALLVALAPVVGHQPGKRSQYRRAGRKRML